MNEILTPEIVAAVLRTLVELAAPVAVPLGTAEAVACDLSRRFSPHRFRVFSEREAFRGRHCYEILVELEQKGTFGFRFAAADLIPFVIRRAYRPPESCILTVNGRNLELAEAVALMMTDGADRLRERFVDHLLLQDELAEMAPEMLAVSDDDLVEAMNAFRRRNQLYSVASVENWLAERQLTQAGLEARLEQQIKLQKLKEHAVGAKAHECFDEMKPELETLFLEVYRFTLPEIAAEFYDAAKAMSDLHAMLTMYLGLPGTSPHVLERKRRVELGEHHGYSFAPGADGRLSPPQQVGDEWACYRVFERRPAAFDRETRWFVIERLFRERMNRRGAASGVRWHWGRTG